MMGALMQGVVTDTRLMKIAIASGNTLRSSLLSESPIWREYLDTLKAICTHTIAHAQFKHSITIHLQSVCTSVNLQLFKLTEDQFVLGTSDGYELVGDSFDYTDITYIRHLTALNRAWLDSPVFDYREVPNRINPVVFESAFKTYCFCQVLSLPGEQCRVPFAEYQLCICKPSGVDTMQLKEWSSDAAIQVKNLLSSKEEGIFLDANGQEVCSFHSGICDVEIGNAARGDVYWFDVYVPAAYSRQKISSALNLGIDEIFLAISSEQLAGVSAFDIQVSGLKIKARKHATVLPKMEGTLCQVI